MVESTNRMAQRAFECQACKHKFKTMVNLATTPYDVECKKCNSHNVKQINQSEQLKTNP